MFELMDAYSQSAVIKVLGIGGAGCNAVDHMLLAGIVITGGSAKMEGAVELAEEVFHVPVRLGMPQGISGLGEVMRNPIHATGVGLLLYARAQQAPAGEPRPFTGSASNVFERMKSWFQGYF